MPECLQKGSRLQGPGWSSAPCRGGAEPRSSPQLWPGCLSLHPVPLASPWDQQGTSGQVVPPPGIPFRAPGSSNGRTGVQLVKVSLEKQTTLPTPPGALPICPVVAQLVLTVGLRVTTPQEKAGRRDAGQVSPHFAPQVGESITSPPSPKYLETDPEGERKAVGAAGSPGVPGRQV